MKIRVNLISALCLAAGFASSVAAAKPDAAPPAREAIEWCDIWISHANETSLPRVLLIGDSIVRDYYPEVEKRLVGKAFPILIETIRAHAPKAKLIWATTTPLRNGKGVT